MSQRRAVGEGGLRRRTKTKTVDTPDGPKIYETELWVGTIDLGTDPVTGKRRRREVSGKTKTAVIKKMRQAQKEADAGARPEAGLTVEKFLNRWVETVVANRVDSPNTVANYAQHVRVHLIPAIGKIRLDRLTADDVDRMLHAKADAGYARNTVNRMRSVLTDALNHAEARQLVTRNAGRLSVMPKCDPRPKRKALTVTEARQLIDAAYSEWVNANNETRRERLAAMIPTGLMLGLRPGELTALLWEDIDLDGTPPTLRVTGAVKRNPDDGSVTRGAVKKSTSGERAIALPAELVARLRAHKAAQAEEKMKLPPGVWQDNGLVFPSERGTLLDPSGARRIFARVAERAGLEGVVPYTVRHSAVSQLVDQGLSIEEVADLLGDDPRTLYRHYRHRLQPVVTAAADVMDRAYRTAES